MSAIWEKLETHVVDGAFTLQRCIGSTDHSGVFLTRSAEFGAGDLALKLIPLDTKSAQAQLARWRAATRLSHANLLRIFKVGVYQLEGTHYLYVLMEYADQTLAQVLEGRALTEDETREMLVPTLAALEYLHKADIAHGTLTPSNILVVGDQLKLASDTLRFFGEPDADASSEGDVRALGATLCEALTRVRPTGGEGAGDVEIPAALPESFRAVVSRCLSPDPRNRPTVAALNAWLRGEPLATSPPLPPPASAPAAAPAPPLDATAPVAVTDRPKRSALPWALGAMVVAVLAWIAYRGPSTVEQKELASPPVVEPPAPATPAVTAPEASSPVLPVRPAAPAGIATSEVMPTVSQSALDTVSGTLRVTVHVIVDKAGTVTAATAEDPGPSRYFERRALDASRKWTFAPADTTQRTMRIRFAFTRSGVTATASPLP